ELRRSGRKVEVSQRRFFADPEQLRHPPAKTSGETWLVPMVLRWADDEGPKESRLLLRGARDELTLPARGEVRFVCGNRGGAGFYRVAYEPTEIAALA